MQRSMKLVAIAAAVIVIVAAVGYAAYVSTLPSSTNDCAGVQTTVSGVAPAIRIASPSPVALSPHASQAPESHPSLLLHSGPRAASSGVINVVAAENFWGSLVAQLGGNQTSVLSIVSDPNADPHEYESNTSDAVAITNAQFIIVNGVGYDDWALQLISAESTPGQVVLNVGQLTGVTVGGGVVSGNPHQWYNPIYVNTTVAAMYSDLVKISPGEKSYFSQNYAVLNSSLAQLYGEATSIKQHFAGTEVAATEDIFVYLANFTNLNLVSPPEFMEAVAEGDDPPAQSVVVFQCQLESGHVSVLVYNEQTVTPITANLKAIASSHNVPIVGVTETIQPPDVTFQAWMYSQYLALYNALNANALGQ
ncbi:MAG TPA: zinc ABC transporter substrate-binding protein [Thermoplasmata archaeon]|nr:zinc ABC transporter substrate-binding protein [Thermoplasmata archaeon]